MVKNRTITKNLNESDDSFYVTLKGGPESKKSFTTNFTNKLFQPLYLKGDYEVALSNIYFSNVLDMNLGQIEISFNNKNWSYVILLDIEAKMGDKLKNLFFNINEKIHEMVKEKEYSRRLNMRKNSNLEKSEHLLPNGEKFISLPLGHNKIYDEFVYDEIKEMSPKIIYENDHLTFETTSEFSFKFYGNLLNLIPDLKEKQFNVLSEPILIRDSYLPNFKTLLISTNIINFENYGDGKELQILKILNVDDNTRVQSINISNDNLTFQKIKIAKNNIYHTIINEISISLFPDIYQDLKIDQGEVLIRLYFRKIKTI